MTNLEKIKSMNAEELAEYFCKLMDCRYCPIYCTRGECRDNEIKQWLESESEEEK